MSAAFQFDVFLSHGAKDKAITGELAERLKADRLRVWLEQWETRPSDSKASKLRKIERGLAESQTLILALSTKTSRASGRLSNARRPDFAIRPILIVALFRYGSTMSRSEVHSSTSHMLIGTKNLILSMKY